MVNPEKVYKLRQDWENYRVYRIAQTEKLIKGRCVLRDRHWMKLVDIWQDQFFKDNQINRHSPLFRVEWTYSGYLIRNGE